VTKDFGGGLSLAVAYIGTDAKKVNGIYSYSNPATNKNNGGSTGVVTLTKTF